MSPFLTLSCPSGSFVDFTLPNARQFYSSMGNPLGRKGIFMFHVPTKVAQQLAKEQMNGAMLTNVVKGTHWKVWKKICLLLTSTGRLYVAPLGYTES